MTLQSLHSMLALPAYLGGPVGLRTFAGQTIYPTPFEEIVASGAKKVLLINSGGVTGRLALEGAIRAEEDAVIFSEMGVVPLQGIYGKLFNTLLQNRGGVVVIPHKFSYQTLEGEVVHVDRENGIENAIAIDRLAQTIQKEMDSISEQQGYRLQVKASAGSLNYMIRQPNLAPEDRTYGLDAGRRAALAIHHGYFGYEVPLRAETELISLEYAVSPAAEQRMKEIVLEHFRAHFGG